MFCGEKLIAHYITRLAHGVAAFGTIIWHQKNLFQITDFLAINGGYFIDNYYVFMILISEGFAMTDGLLFIP